MGILSVYFEGRARIAKGKQVIGRNELVSERNKSLEEWGRGEEPNL